ncbi:DedA family protein [Microvirga sp. W0021]|uniref:DedA family protein n=1 Tax=Hohaiivirga grylli TaxID=3133970 RepID=A0ABV0BMD6_9HYPH
MDIKSFTDPVILFVQHNAHLAPLVCGLLAFGESLAVVSLVIPASTILLALGALIASANLDFWPIAGAAALGATLGDWVSYEIAKYYKYAVFRVWPLSRNPQMVEKGSAFIQKHGIWAVFIGRFFGPFRAVVPLFAGIFTMPFIPFMIANVASAIIWAIGLLIPGLGLTWLMA